MKKYLFFLFILGFFNPLFSQHTRAIQVDSIDRGDVIKKYKKAIIITPYKSIYHHSQIDKKFFDKNNPLSMDEIRERISNELCLELKIYLKMAHENNAIIALIPTDSAQKQLLYNIQSLKGENYALFNSTLNTDTSNVYKIKQKLKFKESDKEPVKTKQASYLEHGQLNSKIENDDKYMAAKVENAEKIEALFEEKIDAYLFLNQIDLLFKIDYSSPIQKYILQVHYSYMDNSLNTLKGGIEMLEFTEADLPLEYFRKNVLQTIAKKIVDTTSVH